MQVPSPKDAPPAARLREAGAVIFSKTTMPDYGMLSSGLSSFHPLTRNPWDVSKNPGGSSSGAGAAGAAGYGPLHLGTDIGGSVRLPACWNGLVALKPSLGRVPVDPPYVGRVAGPMTRIVDDAALMMSVLSRSDRRDGMSLPAHEINWKALEKSPRKLRIGLMLDPGVGQKLEKEVREVAVKAAKAFESAGAVVTEVDGILTREMLDGLDNFWRARAWDDLSRLPPEQREKSLPYIYKWAEAGAKLSGLDVIRGFNATMAIRAAAAKLFCDLDYVVSPVSPVVNFRFTPQRPRKAVRAHLLHRAVEHVGKPGRLDQWRLRQQGLSDRRADHRPPLRRSRGARHGQGVRRPAGCAKAVAGPAEKVILFVIPGYAVRRRPGIHTPDRGYGFRARRFAPPRNDGRNEITSVTSEETTHGV
jgi:Asp-tRNA(Asn)/Glu-tRNA(Gln) amidotransferase A subunit family amidase